MKRSKKPLSIAIALTLLTANFAQAQMRATVDSPFAPLALDLQNYSEVTLRTVKPNIMLLVDDSGSMSWGSGVSGKTRLQLLQEALNNILNIPRYADAFNWGYKTLWNNNGVGYDGFRDANALRASIDRSTPSGGTPTTVQYYYDGLGQVFEHGFDLVCRRNYIIVLSDGDSNRSERYGQWISSNTSYKLKKRTAEYDFGKTPSSYQVNSENTNYQSGQGNGISFFSHPVFNSDLKVSDPNNPNDTDAEGNSWNGVSDGVKLHWKKQNIGTFTIGFGTGISIPGTEYLKDGATEAYYNVRDMTTIQQVFDDILAKIQKDGGVSQGGSIAVSQPLLINKIGASSTLTAYLTLNSEVWTSKLQFTNANTTTGALINGNDIKEADMSVGQKDLLHDGTSVLDIRSLSDSQAANIFGLTGAQEWSKGVKPYFINGEYSYVVNSAMGNALDANGKPIPNGNAITYYRDRYNVKVERQMGDVGNAPLLSADTIPNANEYPRYIFTAANDGFFYVFKGQTMGAAKPYKLTFSYLPAAMERENSTSTIAKQWVKVAQEGYGRAKATDPNPAANPNASGHHHVYLNNGGIFWRKTAAQDGPQQTFVLGTMGQGGRGMYALNLGGKNRVSAQLTGLDAPSNQWETSVPLFETEKGANNTLGYTVSTPQVGKVATVWNANGTADKTTGIYQYAFLANGYSSWTGSAAYDSEPTLYVYDALGQEFAGGATTTGANPAGTLITKISVGETCTARAGTQSFSGGLSTPRLVDNNLDGIFEYAYAGDQCGNIWRFILKGNPSTWHAVKIYSGDVSQPIMSRPSVYRQSENQYIVSVGTGSNIYQEDLNNKDQQVMLGVYDDLSDDNPTPISQANMTQQEVEETTQLVDATTGVKQNLRYVSNHPLNGNKGWYLVLPNGVETAGERIVADSSVLQSTVFFTTVYYKWTNQQGGSTSPGTVWGSKSCGVESKNETVATGSYMMQVDITSGGSPRIGGAYFKRDDNNNFPLSSNGNIVSGVSLTGASSPLTLASPQVADNAVNPNGGAESGEEGLKIMRNDCMPKDTYYNSFVVDQTGINRFPINVRICSKGGRLIRINQRPVM